jgi:hypothetical protein
VRLGRADAFLVDAARVLTSAEALQRLSQRTFGSTEREPTVPADGRDDRAELTPAAVGAACAG